MVLLFALSSWNTFGFNAQGARFSAELISQPGSEVVEANSLNLWGTIWCAALWGVTSVVQSTSW